MARTKDQTIGNKSKGDGDVGKSKCVVTVHTTEA